MLSTTFVVVCLLAVQVVAGRGYNKPMSYGSPFGSMQTIHRPMGLPMPPPSFQSGVPFNPSFQSPMPSSLPMQTQMPIMRGRMPFSSLQSPIPHLPIRRMGSIGRPMIQPYRRLQMPQRLNMPAAPQVYSHALPFQSPFTMPRMSPVMPQLQVMPTSTPQFQGLPTSFASPMPAMGSSFASPMPAMGSSFASPMPSMGTQLSSIPSHMPITSPQFSPISSFPSQMQIANPQFPSISSFPSQMQSQLGQYPQLRI